MNRFLLLLSIALLPAGAFAQDTTFYSVSAIEVKPSARSTAVQALKQYKDASRIDTANLRTELFEQVDRPGHLMMVETWRSQAAFDAGTAVTHKKLVDAIQPIRTSDWDQRPYKTLSVASGPAEATGRSAFMISHVDVSPDPKVAGFLKDLAEKSRLEEGNVRFDVLQHTMRANHFEVIETWQNQKALDAHAAAPHTRQYRDNLQPLLGSPLDERIYKPIE